MIDKEGRETIEVIDAERTEGNGCCRGKKWEMVDKEGR